MTTTTNMDTIYEENMENASEFIPPPPQQQRKILRATHSQKQQRLSKNDENVNTGGGRRNTNQAAANAPKELTLAEKVQIRVDRLEIVRVLGEGELYLLIISIGSFSGAFGEVLLVVDKDDHTVAAAMKRICLRGLDGDTTKAVKKEALLQRAVKNHQNVLKYLTMRAAGDIFELYLEYADGGELFDQIGKLFFALFYGFY